MEWRVSSITLIRMKRSRIIGQNVSRGLPTQLGELQAEETRLDLIDHRDSDSEDPAQHAERSTGWDMIYQLIGFALALLFVIVLLLLLR